MGLIFDSPRQMEGKLADRPAPFLSDGTPLSALIDFDKREISMRVLSDPEIHRLELKYIFARSWVVVGHVTEIPQVGDFVLRHIGQDAVIVTRARNGEISILLNACSHRGMEVCWAEKGNAATFKCPYHGWAFNGEGKLLGAPFEKEMYGDWDKSQYGLRRARVAIRHGVIFGNFDQNAPPLDEWLGEFGWYFDVMYGSAEMEVVSAGSRGQVAANWKAAAEQNCGDGYHTVTLHHCLVELGLQPPPQDSRGWALDCHDVSSYEGHGLRCVEYAHDVAKVAPKPEPFPVGWFVAGAMFPGVNVGGNASRGGAQILGPAGKVGAVAYSANIGAMTPRGPNAYAQWSAVLVDKKLPEPVRATIRRQATFAVIVADDQEAWPSMTKVAQGYVGQEQTIKYNAILGPNRPKDWPGPALVHQGFSKDDNQWHFWMRWYDMMTADRG